MIKMTKDEIIEGLQKALLKYANSNNWAKNEFVNINDICNDSTSSSYGNNGEIARQALDYYHWSMDTKSSPIMKYYEIL